MKKIDNVFSGRRFSSAVHRRPAAASLVFLSRAARARIIPPDLGSIAPWFTPVGTRTDLPMRPEILIRPQKPSRHVRDDFFALLRADCSGWQIAPSGLSR